MTTWVVETLYTGIKLAMRYSEAEANETGRQFGIVWREGVVVRQGRWDPK